MIQYVFYDQSVRVNINDNTEFAWLGAPMEKGIRDGVDKLVKFAYKAGKEKRSNEVSKILKSLTEVENV